MLWGEKCAPNKSPCRPTLIETQQKPYAVSYAVHGLNFILHIGCYMYIAFTCVLWAFEPLDFRMGLSVCLQQHLHTIYKF